MTFVLHLGVNTLAVWASAYILRGVHVEGWPTALVVAIVLGLINALLKPILILLTLPITLVTMGLFVFVINGLLILLVDKIVPGFQVDGFWWAVLYSLVLALVNAFLSSLV
jgi:putative membrane protein